MDPVMLSLARAGSSFALDIIILAYPIPKIAKLNITPQRKLLSHWCLLSAVSVALPLLCVSRL
jgi:hypothetical protein